MAKHTGIPTTYKGIRFRSRLEARWAVWLDLKKDSKWQYEPFDMDGYIPDFLIEVEGIAPVIAEVKPVTTLEAFAFSDDGEKVRKALHANTWFRQTCAAFFVFGASPEHSWAYYMETGEWRPLPSSEGHLIGWRTAGNAVQWKAPK